MHVASRVQLFVKDITKLTWHDLPNLPLSIQKDWHHLFHHADKSPFVLIVQTYYCLSGQKQIFG